MQGIFIILLCTREYNCLGDSTRQHEVLKENTSTRWFDRKADSMRLGGEHKTKLNYSIATYHTKFDAKMTKMKWNCTANMIMSVLGIVCYLILYFPVNQGLAINLPWPARKNKQRMCFELFEVFLTSFLTNYWNHFPHKASNQ